MADCGARNFELPKIVRIEEPTVAEMDEWRKSYEKFHAMVMAEKGHDFCEEDVDNITLFTCDEPLDFTHTLIIP